MKLHIHRSSIAWGAICLIGIGLFFADPALAVTIDQPILELNVDPGDRIEKTIRLYDDSQQGVTVYPWVYNFTDDPVQEGVIRLIYDPAELKPDRAWVSNDTNTVTLPTDGSIIEFPYALDIPADAEPGTHLIALTFRTRPPKSEELSGSIVYVGGDVVASIFLRVSGAVNDTIDADFRVGSYTNVDPRLTPAARAQFFKPKRFFIKPPVDFLLTVYNQGNTHQKPDGNVRVTNDLLGGAAEKLLINPENKIILPGTDRTFAVPSFGNGFMFGKYRAKLTLLYGSPLRPFTEEVTFWVIPLLEILFFILFVLLFVAIWYNWKIRREHRDRLKEKEREKQEHERELREQEREKREHERELREQEREKREQEREERLQQAIKELKSRQHPSTSGSSPSSSPDDSEPPTTPR